MKTSLIDFGKPAWENQPDRFWKTSLEKPARESQVTFQGHFGSNSKNLGEPDPLPLRTYQDHWEAILEVLEGDGERNLRGPRIGMEIGWELTEDLGEDWEVDLVDLLGTLPGWEDLSGNNRSHFVIRKRDFSGSDVLPPNRDSHRSHPDRGYQDLVRSNMNWECLSGSILICLRLSGNIWIVNGIVKIKKKHGGKKILQGRGKNVLVLPLVD